MGGKNSKKKSKKKDSSKKDVPEHEEESIVNITNDIFIGSSKSNPTEDYLQMNFLGEGSFAAVYKVKNR
ncbi:MAG: hypothetical protein MJ252_26360, partial [archaeon]|nr:hypothetical protein [archaeon]